MIQQQKGFVLFLTLILLSVMSLVLISEYQQFWLLKKGLKERALHQHTKKVLSQCLDTYPLQRVSHQSECKVQTFEITPFISEISISYEQMKLSALLILNGEPSGLQAGVYAKSFSIN